MYVIELTYADGSNGYHPRTWSSVTPGTRADLELASVYPTRKGAATHAGQILKYGGMIPDPVYQVVKAEPKEVEIKLK